MNNYYSPDGFPQYQWNFLDDNRESDKIVAVTNPIGTAALAITLTPGQKLRQWNFRGTYNFIHFPYFLTGDFDHNRQKEIYVFTVSGDSILLHIIDDFENQGKAKTDRFVTKINLKDGKCDPTIIPAHMDDMNGDGFDELIFGINTGFSIYPRKIFRYDVSNDNLMETPENVYFLTGILQADISGDGKNEIFTNGYAAENIHDSSYIYVDSSCWLMAFDRNLSFLFPPKQLSGKFSTFNAFSLENPGKKTTFIGTHEVPDSGGNKLTLFQFDRFGKISNSIQVRLNVRAPFVVQFNDQNLLACPVSMDSIILFNHQLQIEEVINPGFLPYSHEFLDVDGDGKDEWIFLVNGSNQIVITRPEFKHPVKVNIEPGIGHYYNVSVKYKSGKQPIVEVSTGTNSISLEYSQNPLYYWRFGIYGAIYLGLFLFTLLIRKIQRNQLQRHYLAEKKITELQLKIVRNQMDPHFAMNAITSVLSALKQNRAAEASQHLFSFAKLYRHLVLTSDSITCKLSEELEFTENYITMMQFRFADKFQYSKDISPEIDAEFIEIPKMIIQSQVENAIRHGLIPRNGGGILTLQVSHQDSMLKISVTDNGVGRGMAQQAGEPSTGKGNQMIREYSALYQKITGHSVLVNIHDLYDESGESAGTKVEIWIGLAGEKIKDKS